MNAGNPFPGPRLPALSSRDKLSTGLAGLLIVAAAFSWLASYYLMPQLSSGDGAIGRDGVSMIVSSLSVSSLAIFEVVWLVGMAAMMFPAMIPVVLFYNSVVAEQEANPSQIRSVGTPLFLLGYLATYAGLGLLIYLAIFGVLSYTSSSPALSSLGRFAPGFVLIVAGLYQVSSLKLKSLLSCTSPADFFVLHSRTGLLGAVQMGLSHGKYCVGCCWAYMLVMMAVVAMSIPFMAVMAGIIAFEKVAVRGAIWFSRVVAGALIAIGFAVIYWPEILAVL
ncbi:MAG: DUF2182 domain-containing protein [Nitrososphaerales archaeon]|nr:DUF2182 domain-containing protein [Nitrososphaerales archaeon]